MKFLNTLGVLAITFSIATISNASEVDSDAGAKIVAPLEITNTTGLYFGTIAPSLHQDDTVQVGATGTRVCGTSITCLTNDHSAAQFLVSGESDMMYYVNLPADLELANSAGDTMKVFNFTSSATDDIGTLTGGTDDFGVGADLLVFAGQKSGDYVGTFTVTVEYN